MDEFRCLATEYYAICQDNPNVFPYDFRNRKNEIFYNERKKMQRIILGGATLNSVSVRSAVDIIHRGARGAT